MGVWDLAPWDNDGGADWFDDMFEKTNLADHVRQTLRSSNPQDDYEQIRAAASLVVMLGHTYIWPVETLDQDLSLAASKLAEILTVPELGESEDLTSTIREEIQELRSRIKDANVESPPNKDRKKWWEFWK
ncbi:MAG: DUF4259 domain-containing protein [Sedimentisphaerales bacterium]|nr:DUF4259 domain-containing protein [Sedimentisphaerales bacterium]